MHLGPDLEPVETRSVEHSGLARRQTVGLRPKESVRARLVVSQEILEEFDQPLLFFREAAPEMAMRVFPHRDSVFDFGARVVDAWILRGEIEKGEFVH